MSQHASDSLHIDMRALRVSVGNFNTVINEFFLFPLNTKKSFKGFSSAGWGTDELMTDELMTDEARHVPVHPHITITCELDELSTSR